MAISFSCVFCDKQYVVRNDQAGQDIRCTGCGASLTVPEDDAFKTNRPVRNDLSSAANSRSRDATYGDSPADDWQWLGRSTPGERPATPKTESSGGPARAIAVVVLLVSMLLPISKLLLQQKNRGQRRPVAQHPFAHRNGWHNWQSYTSDEEDFSIDAPEAMGRSPDVPPYASRTYSWKNPVMDGGVTVVELTPSIALDIPTTTVYSVFQGAIIDEEQPRGLRGRARLSQKTTPEFHEFTSESGLRKFRCRIMISGTTLYIVKLGYRDSLMPVDQEIFNRYFDSFTLTKPGVIPAEAKHDESYLDRRRTFEKVITKHMPAPQDWQVQIAPENVEVIRYASGEFGLPAWLAIPNGAGRDDKRPAFVYLHGGNAFDKLDYEFCKPALDAGFVVLVPIFRGENGQSGNYEAMLGETDDAASAVRWLSEHEAVDAEKIFVFGHDFGGGLAGLLSLRDDVPIRHTGSCGGLYHDFSFYIWALNDTLPFAIADKDERDMRLLIANLTDMQRPHLAYVGDEDYNQLFVPTIRRRVLDIQVEQPEWKSQLQIETVSGDHISSLDESIQRYVEFMKRDSGHNGKPHLVDPKKKTLNL